MGYASQGIYRDNLWCGPYWDSFNTSVSRLRSGWGGGLRGWGAQHMCEVCIEIHIYVLFWEVPLIHMTILICSRDLSATFIYSKYVKSAWFFGVVWLFICKPVSSFPKTTMVVHFETPNIQGFLVQMLHANPLSCFFKIQFYFLYSFKSDNKNSSEYNLVLNHSILRKCIFLSWSCIQY